MGLIRKHLLHLSEIPDDLDSVTHIDRSEVDPQSLGLNAADRDFIWHRIQQLYRSGTHPGIAVSLRYRGKPLIARGIGHSHGNGPQDPADAEKRPMRVDTPVCLYSSSKAVTALLMHMLAEEGKINVMDPVAFYAPEFARAGKKNITIHQILAHRGGIPGLPADATVETLWDEERTWDLLCDAEPIITDGSRLAYHAITGGFVLDRVVRKVTGDTIDAYLRRKLREPMGLTNFTYGMDDDRLDELAPTYGTGPQPGPLLNTLIKRALGAPMREVLQACNDPRFQRAIIPAANLVASADEASALFQMMLNGGKFGRRRICSPQTVARAIQEFGNRSIDATLGVPMRYSAGLMLGDVPFGVWGPDSGEAFGHLGLINKFCWADPQRELSASILTTGLPLLTPHIVPLVNTLRAINARIPKAQLDQPFVMGLLA